MGENGQMLVFVRAKAVCYCECVCGCCVRALVLSCRLFVLKVRGIAEIESNLKDTALEQVPEQMDPLR